MGNLAQVQVGPYRNLRTQMAATTTFGSGVNLIWWLFASGLLIRPISKHFWPFPAS